DFLGTVTGKMSAVAGGGCEVGGGFVAELVKEFKAEGVQIDYSNLFVLADFFRGVRVGRERGVSATILKDTAGDGSDEDWRAANHAGVVNIFFQVVLI